MEIKERIISIRKYLKLNQTEFARKLNLTQSLVSRLESGSTPLIDQNIQLICLTFNINERWLRNGEGAMFKEGSPHKSEMLQIFEQLSPEGQNMVLEYVALILKNEKAMKGQSTDTVKQSAEPDAVAERGTEG